MGIWTKKRVPRRRNTMKGGYSLSLLDAARDGNLRKVIRMVEQGVDQNEMNHALAIAAKTNRLAIVRYLVEHGADQNVTNKKGATPLILATFKNHLDVVKYLVDNGADMEKAVISDGYTALLFAADKGYTEIVKYLVQHGADKNKVNDNGASPLLIAAARGRLGIVQYLIEQGADLNKVQNDGTAPLLAAAWNDHLSVVKYLVQQGVDPNKANNKGWTPLMFAAQNGHLEIVEFLVENGADTLLQDNHGDTAEKLAVAEEIKQYLRDYPRKILVDRFIQAVEVQSRGRIASTTVDPLVAYIRNVFENQKQGDPLFVQQVQRICSRPAAKRVLVAALSHDPFFAGLNIDEYCLRPVATEAELHQELPTAHPTRKRMRTRSDSLSPPHALQRPNPRPIITNDSGYMAEIDGRSEYISFLSPDHAPITARQYKRGGRVRGTRKNRKCANNQ